MSSKQDSGSGSVAKNIPTVTGTANYHAWLDSIESFLMTLKVWQIAAGTSTYPVIAAGPPAVTVADQNNWIVSYYEAVNDISLCIKEDLRTAIARTYDAAHTSLAHTTLANLATLYTTIGPTGQFYLFREIINWHIGNKEPSVEIAHLQDLFAWLNGAGLDLPVNLCVMLICTGLGDNYSHLITTIVHTKATAQFTPDVIIPMILAESQQQGNSLTHRISC
jgi:hypothetical protein